MECTVDNLQWYDPSLTYHECHQLMQWMESRGDSLDKVNWGVVDYGTALLRDEVI